jgi:putative zinc ribbon protein
MRPSITLADATKLLKHMELDPHRNDPLDLDAISVESPLELWWRCPTVRDHVFLASVNSRWLGSACPLCCAGNPPEPEKPEKPELRKKEESLAAVAPRIAAEWHPTKNGALTAHDVARRSKRQVWWRCARDPRHSFRAAIRGRTQWDSCPICPHQDYVFFKSTVAWTDPALAALWHPTVNGALLPSEITAGSTRTVAWLCPSDPAHTFWASPYQMARRKARGEALCPFCKAAVREE